MESVFDREQKDWLVPGAYCWHKSWGFGKIRSRDDLLGELTVDFEGKPGHRMEVQYARSSLTQLPQSHILVRRAENPEELRAMIHKDPLALLRLYVESFGERASAEHLQGFLCPSILPKEAWKKWWESTKNLARKEGSFTVPTRKGEPIRCSGQEPASWEKLVEEFRALPGIAAKVRWLRDRIQGWSPGAGRELAEALARECEALSELVSSRRGADFVELYLLLEELASRAGGQEFEDSRLGKEALTLSTEDLLLLLERLSPARRLRVLKALLQQEQTGKERVWGLVSRASVSLLKSIERACEASGSQEELQRTVEALLRERSVSPELLLWICQSRKDWASRQGVRIFWLILFALEKDQLEETRKARKLYDVLQNDRTLVPFLVEQASLEEVQELARTLAASAAFTEVDKRFVIGTLVKAFPEVGECFRHLPAASAGSQEEASPLWVTRKSLERRRAELEEIIEKKLPQVSRDIAIARSYGDLRENHEYKAAKEMQAFLLKRKDELQQELSCARVIDLASVSTDVVGIGTQVRLVGTEDGKVQTVTILGAWDSDPSRGIIAYLTDQAQRLLGKKVGDTVVLSSDDGTPWKARITTIEVAREEE